jgi:flagellar protein FliS
MSLMLPRQASYQQAAGRYGDNATATASPARLLVMLYDRLVTDLVRAEQAQRRNDRERAHLELSHAQEIVAELMTSLDVTAWDGGPGLMSLYQWLMVEMIKANVRQDATITAACRACVEPLRDAWTEAAAATTAPARPGLSA